MLLKILIRHPDMHRGRMTRNHPIVTGRIDSMKATMGSILMRYAVESRPGEFVNQDLGSDRLLLARMVPGFDGTWVGLCCL